jgi:hypothetical protein
MPPELLPHEQLRRSRSPRKTVPHIAISVAVAAGGGARLAKWPRNVAVLGCRCLGAGGMAVAPA